MSLNVQPGFRAAETVKPVAVPIQGKTSPTTAGVKSADAPKKNGGDEFSFMDLLDIVNPLQHVPIVSTIYREMTGDKISNFSRVAGGALFGGFAGAAIGLINTVAVTDTGKDVGQLALSEFGFETNADKTAADDEIQMADLVPPEKPLVRGTESTPATGEAIMADAMPETEKLNELAPGADFAQTVEPQKIPNAMMDALLKYQELQTTVDASAIATAPVAKRVTPEDKEKQSHYLRASLPADRRILTR